MLVISLSHTRWTTVYFCVQRFTLRLSSDSNSRGMKGKKRKKKLKKKKKKTSSLDDTTVGEQQHLSSQHAWRDHESITLPSSPFPALPDMVALPDAGVQEQGRVRKAYQDPSSHREAGRETHAHSKEQRICHSPVSLRVHVLFNSAFIIIPLKACHKWERESVIESL